MFFLPLLYEYRYAYQYHLMKTKSFELLEERIQAELSSPDDPATVNYWKEAQEVKDEISRAVKSNDVSSVRSTTASYGGLVKRWKRFLIEELTEIVFSGSDTSRNFIRTWQKRVFGQAVSSERLSKYASPSRSGGGRVLLTVTPEYLEAEAADLFEKTKDLIKTI